MKIQAGIWCKLTSQDKMILLKGISKDSVVKKSA